jgi:glycosyltransferase involved in cell wall biosynthesis
MAPITIIILTHNEACNISACLDSAESVSDDLHVVDSGSIDGTQEMVRARGAQIHTHAFESFGSQRNWAIDYVPHKYPWAFHLDADERFTPALVDEIRSLLASNPSEAGFLVPSKLMLRERWLKRTGEYPAYQLRLFHRARLRFADAGHGQREVTEGRVGALLEGYEHHPFRKGLDAWFEKHAGYAMREALEQIKGGGSLVEDVRSAAFQRGVERRRALKRLSYRLPVRGWLRFFHLVVLRAGFLDGRPGIAYARMKALYEGMIGVYLEEHRELGDESTIGRLAKTT